MPAIELKSISKIAKWPSLRALALKSKFIWQIEFSDKNVTGEQGLALQQRFKYKFYYFFENSNRHKISFFNARGLKPGHFDIFDTLFPFLAFFKLQPIILWKEGGLAAKS